MRGARFSNDKLNGTEGVYCNVYTHMLQVYVLNVSTLFKCMLQVVYLDVAYVALAIQVHCKCMFSNVSAVSNVCCKYFI